MTGEQTEIEGDQEVAPNPEEYTCEWCPETAKVAIELKRKVGRGRAGTGQYVMACHAHKTIAEGMVEESNNTRKK